MRRHLMIALTLVLLLNACATEEGYRQVVQSWVGFHADQLVSARGPPQSVYQLSNGGEVLEYDQQAQRQYGGYTSTSYS